tara:strand:- start:1297 stop:3075 length:1779 start_codon:yes stop_codon:yes gene_type:complete
MSRYLNNSTFFNIKKRYYTGANVLYDHLKHHNFKYAFGYSGGAILPVLDKFYDGQISFIMNRNEQCAGHAAEGYAKSSGKTGLIVSTSGPGLTNLVTPLLDAKNDGVPLLALTGQVPTNALGTDAFQESPAIEITKPVTKWNYQIKNVNEIEWAIDKAIYIANDGRKGPVHLDLCKDIMSETITDINSFKKFKFTEKINKLDIKNLEKVLYLINIAKKPVIIAGQGTLDCHYELREFVHRANIPITTTLHAMGVFNETRELSLHMLGMHGSVYANKAVQEADLILAIGSRFDDRTTGNLDGYAPEAKKAEKKKRGGIVHFNIDDNEFDRVVKSTINIKGDCKNSIEWLNDNIVSIKRDKWISRIKYLKQTYPFSYLTENKNELKVQNLIEKFSQKSQDYKKNLFITTGVGNHQMMSCQFFRWCYPRKIISSGSLGTMGVGLPFAIGTQFANPRAHVFVIDGDGSFNMTLNDLATIAEYKLPIKILIMNDGRQQMVHIWQKLFFDGRFISTNNKNPDYVKLAESFGIKGIRCDDYQQLDNIFDYLINDFNNPVLVDFRVKPDICLPLVAPGKNLDEMILNETQTNKMKGLAPN